jgi:hypothetical protein
MSFPNIEPCPKSGGGVNDWQFRTAIKLAKYRLSPEQICEFIEKGVQGCGRIVTANEIKRQVRRGADYASIEWEPGERPEKSFRAELDEIPVDGILVNQSIETGFGLPDLYERSPLRDLDADYMINVLFPDNPFLCCGYEKYKGACKRAIDWWNQWNALQFIVPCPQLAATGINSDGKESWHCLSNCLDRRFLIVEFDSGTIDAQAAILWHLKDVGPLAMVVDSRGKSLHGWFYCYGAREETHKRFMRYARKFGADPAHWTRSQFTRMPNGAREGKEQVTYYFNPAVIK